MVKNFTNVQIENSLKQFQNHVSMVMNSDANTCLTFFNGFMNFCETDEVLITITLPLKKIDVNFKEFWNRKWPNGQRIFDLPLDSLKRIAFLYQLCYKIYTQEKGFNYLTVGLDYFGNSKIKENIDLFNQSVIQPVATYITQQLAVMNPSKDEKFSDKSAFKVTNIPLEITHSLESFQKDHLGIKNIAFIMMQFGQTQKHSDILVAIRKSLKLHDIISHRADDRQYHDDIFYNILTYLHGCDFGIAVFDQIEDKSFNPNVSLEVGYMLALGKPICYLKEKSLPSLHTDLVGKYYQVFDIDYCESSIDVVISQWLSDKRID